MLTAHQCAYFSEVNIKHVVLCMLSPNSSCCASEHFRRCRHEMGQEQATLRCSLARLAYELCALQRCQRTNPGIYPNLVRWAYTGHHKYCCTICWLLYVQYIYIYTCLLLTMHIPQEIQLIFAECRIRNQCEFLFLTSQSAFTCFAYSKTSN